MATREMGGETGRDVIHMCTVAACQCNVGDIILSVVDVLFFKAISNLHFLSDL